MAPVRRTRLVALLPSAGVRFRATHPLPEGVLHLDEVQRQLLSDTKSQTEKEKQMRTTILAALLSVAVLLVIGNTIRLAIQNRRDEIIITKLIGATDSFIQRPFLYTGLWYVLIGSFVAVILIEISLFIISSPVERLTTLYQSDFTIAGMSLTAIFTLLISGSMLGLSGSWIAVNRHLKEIEPT